MKGTGEDAQWHPKYKLLNTRFVSATPATLLFIRMRCYIPVTNASLAYR